jgi:demethylmenaquinone methyltransferase/2-methoxy-6-polyprenyl-1,4-benzoquinol methylase
MTRYYARRAGEYDRIYTFPEWQRDLEAIRGRLVPLFARRRVFEVACGTGYWTALAASTARAVRATDVNDETLALARARCDGLARVELQCADAYAPPSDGERFDAGLAGFWLSHVDLARLPQFLRAFHARLEQGAVVMMFDERLTGTRRPPTSRVDDAGNRYEPRKLASGERFEIIKNFWPPDRVRALFAAWGDDVVYEEGDCLWILTYRAR